MTASRPANGLQHELFEYPGNSSGIQLVRNLVHEAMRAGAPVVFAATADKIKALRQELGLSNDAAPNEPVHFLDLDGPYRNPALLAQALADFVDTHPEGPAPVGICEAIHSGRNGDELTECDLHDSVLGLLFGEGRSWRLICPIDMDALSASTIERQRRLHGPDANDEAELVRTAPLTEPSPVPEVCTFDADSAHDAREWVVERGRQEGLTGRAIESLEIVAGELTANSITHGGGTGVARVWSTPSTVVCEVADHGQLHDPLAGRRRPKRLQIGGRGLWVVNQLCALQQLRSSPKGTVVRAHILRLAEP